MSKDEKQVKITEDKQENVEKDPFEGSNLSGPGPGRPKGSPNKVTQELRESFKLIAEDNVEELQKALQTLSEKNPDAYVKHLLALSEYVTPKLARSEMTGADNGPLTLYLVDRIEDPESDEDDTD